MKRSEFNSENYTLVKNLTYIECFTHYIREKFKLPAKPPKGLGMISFENDMPVLYILNDYYDDFMEWCTDENVENVRFDLDRRTRKAIDEVCEESGLFDDDETNDIPDEAESYSNNKEYSMTKQDIVEEVIKLYTEGLSAQEIAIQLNIPESSIRHYIANYGSEEE